jgi:hypothetical protein
MTKARLPRERPHATRLGLLLALALVFAQTGAVVHGYSHLSAPGEPGRSGQFCGDCLLFSPLLSAAHGANECFVVASVQTGPPYRPPVAPLGGHSPLNAFLARGPPLLA